MTKRGNPYPTGSKPDKLMRDAIMVALNREAKDAGGQPTRKLALIADKLVELAIEGDIAAIKEINDRVDGRPPQTQVIAGDPMEAVRAMMAGAKESFDLKLQRLIEAGQSQEAERSAGQS